MWKVQTKVIPQQRGKWNDLKVTQKKPDKYTGKERNKGTIENLPIRQCTRTSEGTKFKNITDETWEISLHVP